MSSRLRLLDGMLTFLIWVLSRQDHSCTHRVFLAELSWILFEHSTSTYGARTIFDARRVSRYN